MSSCLLLAAAAPGAGSIDLTAGRSHDIRMSVATLEVTEATLRVRVRFFWDDLQLAVMERTSDMEFRLAETEQVDRVVEEYINDLLTLGTGDGVLRGRLVGRGVEDAPRADEVMWWYALEYALPGPVARLSIQNRLLFNLFEDQRNIVHLTTLSGKERAYYFAFDEDRITVPVS